MAETMEDRRIDVQYVTQTDRGRVSREGQSKAVQISALWTFKQNQDQLFLSKRVHGVHWARSRRSRGEQQHTLNNATQPFPDVMFHCYSLDQNRRVRVCLNNVGEKKLIKYRRDDRAKRVPFQNCCKDQESDVFSQNRHMWFQKKKKRNRKKKHKFWLLVMDVFTLTLLQIERGWISCLYGARTSPTKHKMTFF